jgi:acyl-CoA reductase-like NAD-dependent aldehyde dehydrogenase
MAPMTEVEVATRGLLVGGKWLEEGTAQEIRSPFDGSVVSRTWVGTRKHAEQAIASAVTAFGTTRRLPAFERQRVLRAVAAGIAARREEFARSICLEAGKPIKVARVDVDRAVFTFQIVKRFPVGPITGITPFNFPLNLVAHKVAPAIACGCPMVLKPAPQAPTSSLMLGEIVQQAGWPDGGLNVLMLSNEDTGVLVEDDRIKMISFTGSAPVGWAIKGRSGKKRVTLELGGNAGVIVHGDADLAYAAERCVVGGYAYAGQTCISVQRIFVERSVYGKFTELLVAGVQKLRSGDPMEETTDVGPLIRESDAIRAADWVQEAVAKGARLLCGGKRKGSILEPTVLSNTQPDMKVNCKEIFAPVVTVEPYDRFEEALDRVNHSDYGLQAGVFTRDAKRIFQAFDELEVGGVMAGEVPSFRIDHMPYGGAKDSGLGREGLRYAMEEMTEPRILAMNLR